MNGMRFSGDYDTEPVAKGPTVEQFSNSWRVPGRTRADLSSPKNSQALQAVQNQNLVSLSPKPIAAHRLFATSTAASTVSSSAGGTLSGGLHGQHSETCMAQNCIQTHAFSCDSEDEGAQGRIHDAHRNSKSLELLCDGGS